MLFVCTFDVIFEVEAVVGELPDHLIHPPATFRLMEGMRVTVSPMWNLCEGIGDSSLANPAEPR